MNKKIKLEQMVRLIGVKATNAAQKIREDKVGWMKELGEIEDIIKRIVKIAYE